jgi:hypothetical protein
MYKKKIIKKWHVFNDKGKKMEMRIKIFSEALESFEWKEKYESSCIQGLVDYYKKEKNIQLVSDDSYTHAILLDQVMPVLLVDSDKVVGMSLKAKPNWTKDFVYYAKKNIKTYCVGDDTDVEFLGKPFVKHASFLPFHLPLHSVKEKTKIMSLCVYDKRFSLGNHYCNKIADLIVENNIPIDIFGKTEKDYRGKTGAPHVFSLKEEYAPTEPYESYAFSIVIEENKSNAFYSDKPITSLFSQCVPLYFGSDAIEEELGNHIIVLTGNLAKDMNLIANILKNPDSYYTETDTNELDKKVNLLKNARNLFGIGE